MDAVEGDLSRRVRAKLLNSSAPVTATGALDYRAVEPTVSSQPYIIRYASALLQVVGMIAASP